MRYVIHLWSSKVKEEYSPFDFTTDVHKILKNRISLRHMEKAYLSKYCKNITFSTFLWLYLKAAKKLIWKKLLEAWNYYCIIAYQLRHKLDLLW